MNLMTIKQASDWASQYTQKSISESNISYLIQYGKIKKYGSNGQTLISEADLKSYYNSYNGLRESRWKNKLGDDLNWALSFDNFKEKETTKHVHRLHPYKGKFIPQLVEYFLDCHTDNFKKEVYFQRGDIILDPFGGSGTTLVQANELGMHAIGIDISEFNCLISNTKIAKYNSLEIYKETKKITEKLIAFLADKNIIDFDRKLLNELAKFNNIHFPVPDFRYKLNNGEIDEKNYGNSRADIFLPYYYDLISEFKIELQQENSNSFLDKWYLKTVREEINLVLNEIDKISDTTTKNLIKIILSRTIRSCRATTHSDLATLIDPVITTYYCTKHKKICKPIFSIKSMWERYSEDTLKRIKDFDQLRTDTIQICLQGDSRNIDLLKSIEKINPIFADSVKSKKIAGIFSSPPYVGLIDYHEQHAYAYELYNFPRNDNLEIGPLSSGQGRASKDAYIIGISAVLNNCKKYLAKDYNVFLVANDNYNLYPTIAEKTSMQIVNQFKRPVLNRTERDKGAYSETIFHLKEKI